MKAHIKIQTRINEENKNAAQLLQKKISEKNAEKSEKERIKNQKESELEDLRKQNDNLAIEIGKIDGENAKLLYRIDKRKAEHQATLDDIKMKTELGERLLKEKDRLNGTNAENSKKSEELTEQINNTKNELKKANEAKTAANKKKDETKKKIQNEENKIKACQKEIEKLKINNTAISGQLEDLENNKKYEQRKIVAIEKDKDKFTAERDALINLELDLNREIDEIGKEKERLDSIVRTEQEALERFQKEFNVKDTEYERNIKDKGRMEQGIKEKKNDIHSLNLKFHQMDSNSKKLDNQNAGYKIESLKLNNQIRDLQQQQAKYGAEATTAHARFYQTVEELKIKNSIIDELQKKNIDLENKLKHQQNLYEAVRSDRNLYSKNLLEAQEEYSSLLRKSMMMTHQINQLKEEIKRKDEQFIKENLNFNNAQKQKKNTETKEKMIQERIDSTKAFIKHHESRIAKLKYIISEAQSEKQKQIKDHEMVLNERDILGAQLIKRNQELEVLYEKIKISQSNLIKGETHFREKQKDLNEHKAKLIEIRQELVDSQEAIANIGQFKSEINSLEKEILKGKTKNRALEDELKYPMNVHRWKKLEATDPENYERIMKIQTLMRRLITKTEEVEEKDKLIKEKEQLFVQMKNILSRQPGPETFSQIAIYEASLKDKMSQMKKMLNELKDTQMKAKAHKYEIGMLNEQISKIKQDYFKKRDTEEKHKLRELQASQAPNTSQSKQAYYESLGIQPGLALTISQGNATGSMGNSSGGQTGTLIHPAPGAAQSPISPATTQGQNHRS